MDLAEGHVAALKKLYQQPSTKTTVITIISFFKSHFIAACFTYNLGTGKGQTVLEVVDAFEKASGRYSRIF